VVTASGLVRDANDQILSAGNSFARCFAAAGGASSTVVRSSPGRQMEFE
jgi:hypothetical protein